MVLFLEYTHSYTHRPFSHTMTVFIQALDSGGADQRPPFTSPVGIKWPLHPVGAGVHTTVPTAPADALARA